MDLLHSSFGDQLSNRVMKIHSDFPIKSYNTFPTIFLWRNTNQEKEIHILQNQILTVSNQHYQLKLTTKIWDINIPE